MRSSFGFKIHGELEGESARRRRRKVAHLKYALGVFFLMFSIRRLGLMFNGVSGLNKKCGKAEHTLFFHFQVC